MKTSPIARAGFTLVELLTVMAIIAILVGLVLGTAGFVQKNAARKQAQTQIAAFDVALESYKADNAVFPRDVDVLDQFGNITKKSPTDDLDARMDTDPKSAKYRETSLFLYKQLSGDDDADLSTPPAGKQYFPFTESMLSLSGSTVEAIIDPFGLPYAYSTANQRDSSKGYNPTFDLWSTTGSSDPLKWLTNW